ncbi:hypothetical protein KM043_007392 [Ampulex compressa]|nr:hypothetical protein KM043_007392 [Ampulex compressa]
MLRWLFYPERIIKQCQGLYIYTYCTASNVHNENSANANLQYSPKEELKILQIINKANLMEVSRYNISKANARKLILHRKVHGNFTSICDLFDIKCMKHNILHNFCNSIILNKKKELLDEDILKKHITPVITNDMRKNITSALALHFCNNTISWACLDQNYTILFWDYREIAVRKVSTNLVELIKMTSDITKVIPRADIIVIEEDKITLNTKTTLQWNNLQQHQIIAITLTQLINDIDKCVEQSSALSGVTNIFTLRHRLSAHFIGLVLGTEVISAKYIIEKLVNPQQEEPQFITPMPAIILSEDMKNMYKQMNALKREQMGWALLKAITFIKALSLDQ